MSTPLSKVEADVKAEGSVVWAWLKAHWPHFVTWAGIAYSFLKHM